MCSKGWLTVDFTLEIGMLGATVDTTHRNVHALTEHSMIVCVFVCNMESGKADLMRKQLF